MNQVVPCLPRHVGFSPDSLRYRRAVEIIVQKNTCRIFDGWGKFKINQENIRCLTSKTVVLGGEPPERHLKAIAFAGEIFERFREIVSTNFISRTIDLSNCPDIDETINNLNKIEISFRKKWNDLALNEYCESFIEEILRKKFGNCNELACVACIFFKRAFPEVNVKLGLFSKSNHVFVCLNNELAIDPWNLSILPLIDKNNFRSFVASVLVNLNGLQFHLPVVRKLDVSQQFEQYDLCEIDRS